MNRRTLLKMGSTVGALLAAGAYGRYRFLPPSWSRSPASVDELAQRLFASLEPETRAEVCVEYDHPLRQYHNRGIWGGGLSIYADRFTREQRGLLTDLLYAGLSEQGRERVPNEFYVQFGGVQLMNVLLCGDPSSPPYQLILSGPHLNLRLGGKSREGVAFGGPQVYGDQRGDERHGLPGNIYRFQLQISQRLFRNLAPSQQKETLLETAPIQTQIELLGRAGTFPGTPVASFTPESRSIVRELVDAILSTYRPSDVAYAWDCIEQNGGLDALFLSYYADGEVEKSGEYQIFRLEGPAAVFYFRGAPHVHAFVNVAMDGDAPLSVGEALGDNPAVLEGAEVKGLFERVLRAQVGAELAYYDAEAVVGRLRKGSIRTGDIYNLESWQDHVAVALVKGSNLASSLAEPLHAGGTRIDPDRLYAIATTGEVVSESPEKLGKIESSRRGAMLREASIAYLRKHGFAGLRAAPG
jgi:hypothetical protein